MLRRCWKADVTLTAWDCIYFSCVTFLIWTWKKKKKKKTVLLHFKVDLQPRVGSPCSWDWLKTRSCQTNGIFLTLTMKKEKNQPYLNGVPLLEAALCSVSGSQHSFVPLHSHLFHFISPTTVSCRGAVLCRRSSFKPPISFSSLTFPPYIHFPSPVFYPCPFCVSLCPFFSPLPLFLPSSFYLAAAQRFFLLLTCPGSGGGGACHSGSLMWPPRRRQTLPNLCASSVSLLWRASWHPSCCTSSTGHCPAEEERIQFSHLYQFHNRRGK